MTLLAPLAGVAAISIPAILVLYFLKVRRPESDFSSTLLWRRAVRDRQANAPWQRLRVSRLLLLQLLAALLLVGALVRPALAVHGGLSAHTVVIVDTSASMSATDVAPSRFEDARRQVRDLLDRAGSGQRVTLIEMGPQPRIVASATGDMGPVRDALAAMRPSNGSAALQQALALAASSGGAPSGTRVLLFSDGITQPVPAATSLPFAFEYRRIGISGENLAITALVLHPEPGVREAFLRVQNFGRQKQHADVEWRIDGRLTDARAVDLDGGAASDLSFALSAGADRVSATLRGADALAVDNVAYGVATQPRSLRVTLVTAGNVFIQRALELRPDIQVTTVPLAAYRFDPGVDLYVFDGIAPPTLPSTPAWYLNPPQGQFGAGARVGVGRPRASRPDDPLMRDVDLREVHIARTADLRASSFGGRPLFESDTGPLVLVRDEPTRAVLFGFDLHSSDLPLRTAFPVLVDHLSSDLLPVSVGPRAYHPDEPVLLSAPAGTTATTITRPDGRALRVTTAGGAPVAFDDTDLPGFYLVEQKGPSGTSRQTFAVNAGGTVSAIAPRERIDLVSGRQQGSAPPPPDFSELWPWLAAAVLVVLSLEWLVWHRGS